MLDRIPARSKLAGSISLALHGGLGVLALVFAGTAGTRGQRPPVIELVPVDVVGPPPAPTPPPGPSGPGKHPGAGNTAKTGTLGRRGHDAPPHSRSRAPAIADPLADLTVSYDQPSGPDPGSELGTIGTGTGAGLTGIGTGAGNGFGRFGDGPGTLSIPLPSLARPPRPRHSYRDSVIRGSHKFGGGTVRVILTIDPRGAVRQVRLVHGLDEQLDRRAIDLARSFEFEPALDAEGKPAYGRYSWSFVINTEYTRDENEPGDDPGPGLFSRIHR
ncbi:MAG TPA: energy transducer TonB [Kofleriaceae bacterium]|nr:energy transducer TonB [Kofleriaceae bacterium]